jgi:hypothetical protein
VPVPSEATVGLLGDVPTRLNAICMRAMSEHVSWTMGLLLAVDPPWSLMHSPVATLLTKYLSEAAVEAVKVHNWLILVPLPQPYCCNCSPDVAAPLGTSTQRVLLTLTRLYWPELCATVFHC